MDTLILRYSGPSARPDRQDSTPHLTGEVSHSCTAAQSHLLWAEGRGRVWDRGYRHSPNDPIQRVALQGRSRKKKNLRIQTEKRLAQLGSPILAGSDKPCRDRGPIRRGGRGNVLLDDYSMETWEWFLAGERPEETSGLPGCFIVSSSLLGGAVEGLQVSRLEGRQCALFVRDVDRRCGTEAYLDSRQTGWSLGFSMPLY